MEKKDVLVLDKYDIEYIKSLVDAGGVVPLSVSGNSMKPFLSSKGDTVFLYKVERKEIERGMILLFTRSDKTVVLHRVRKVLGKDVFLINGDSQSSTEIISYKDVIAKVIKYNHNGKDVDPFSKSEKIKQALWYPTLKIRPYYFALLNKFNK